MFDQENFNFLMHKFLTSLLLTGQRSNHSEQEIKSLQLINGLILTGIFTVSFTTIFHLWSDFPHKNETLQINFVALGVLLTTFLLQHQQFYRLVRHFLALNIIVLIGFFSILTDPSSGLNYIFFPLLLLVILIFKRSRNKLIYSMLCMLIFFTVNLYHHFHQPLINYSESELLFGQILNGTISAILIFLQVNYLFNLNSGYEQKLEKANLELRQNSAQLKAIINSTSSLILSTDRNLKILSFNQQFLEFTRTHFAHEAREGMDFYDFIFPGDLYQLEENVNLILSRQKEKRILILNPKEKPDLFLECSLYGLVGVEGDISGLSIYISDISERKKWESTLRESEQRWQFALEGSKTGVWDWDMLSNTVFFSNQWKEIMGFENFQTEDNFDFWSTRIHPDDRGEAMHTLEETLSSQSGYFSNISRMQLQNGDYRWMLCCGKLMEKTREGKPRRMIGTLTDINDRMIAEEALREKNLELEELSREKEAMVGVVAHDLRSPLNKIKGLMNIINLTSEVSPEQELYFDLIRKIIEEGLNQIKDLLDLHVAIDQQENLEFKQVNLSKLLSNLITSFVDDAIKKDIQIHHNWENELVIESDDNILNRILDNLMSNAIKFSPKGKNIYLSGLLNKENRTVEITVKDEGQGFSPEDQEKAFKRFQKLSARPTAGENSTGLGLAIVKRFTTMLGGKIILTSESQKGAEFKIILPLRSRLYRNQVLTA
jgi:PAS domain S-box-containing protein